MRNLSQENSRTNRNGYVVNYHNSDLFVANFIDFMPKRLDVAIEYNQDAYTRSLCNDLDYVEYHFRNYISGRNHTLHRVFFEVRRYLEHGHHPELITKMITDLRGILLEAEFYELMPKLESSATKINKLMEKSVKTL